MRAECFKCGGSGRRANNWIAVGLLERAGRRPQAHLKCLTCGARFYSSLPEAVEAGQQWAAVKREQNTPEPPPVPVPAPTLFGGGLSQQSQGFVKVGSAVRDRSQREVIDWARRAAGERDE